MPTITVHIPLPLQRLTSNKSIVTVCADTVGELIDKLEESHAGIKRLLVQEGKIQKFISVYVNDKDARFLESMNTRLNDGDIVSIVSAVCGG